MNIKKLLSVTALSLAVLFGAGTMPVAHAATKEEAKAVIEKFADKFPAFYDIAVSLFEDMTPEQLDLVVQAANGYEQALKDAGVTSLVELPKEKRDELKAEIPEFLSKLGLRGEFGKDENGITTLKIYKGDELVVAVDGNLDLRDDIMMADNGGVAETTGAPMKQTGTAMPLVMGMSGLIALGGVVVASKKR